MFTIVEIAPHGALEKFVIGAGFNIPGMEYTGSQTGKSLQGCESCGQQE